MMCRAVFSQSMHEAHLEGQLIDANCCSPPLPSRVVGQDWLREACSLQCCDM